MGMGGWRRGPAIGRGSFATVSLAYQSPSGEVFAVKSAELSRSAFLQREQSILAALNCPSIISCLGFDITAEIPNQPLHYNLFIEYAPGGSLSDHIKKQGGRLDEHSIRSHTGEILSGLSYLHSCRLAHCDIKGHNILISSDGQAKIADLGCARWIDDDEEQQISGTPMFMAPEMARGEEQGSAADVWALGCTVIEMATGQPPWPAVSDPVTVLHRIAFSSDIPEIPSWLSEECKDLINKCLRRDPKERWTADQLLKHPFLVSQTDCISKPNSSLHWTSPKSTLDQDLWLSLYEDEVDDELVEDPSDDPAQRIRHAVGGKLECFNWTWDDNWMTIRGDSAECSIVTASEEQQLEISAEERTSSTATGSGNNVVTSSIDTISAEATEDFLSNSDYHSSNIDDCYGYNISETTEKKTIILDLVNGCRLGTPH